MQRKKGSRVGGRLIKRYPVEGFEVQIRRPTLRASAFELYASVWKRSQRLVEAFLLNGKVLVAYSGNSWATESVAKEHRQSESQ